MATITVFNAQGEIVHSSDLIVETKGTHWDRWRHCENPVYYESEKADSKDADSPNPVFCEYSASGNYIVRASLGHQQDQAPIHLGSTRGACSHVAGAPSINLTLSPTTP